MRRLLVCCATALMVMGCLAGPLAASGRATPAQPAVPERPDFDPAASAGVFIGVRSFPTSERLTEEPLVAIPYAVDDAIDLAHLFSRQLRLVEPPNVRLLLSGSPAKDVTAKRLEELLAAGAEVHEAGQAEIFAVLDRSVHAAGPAGMLIVSFATHGVTTPSGQHLMAADSLLRFAEETAISVEKLLYLVAKDSKTSRRLFLLDACRELLTTTRAASGRPDRRSAASGRLIRAIAQSEGEVILFAARRRGFAYDDRARRNGVFTASILDGLNCGSETDDDGLVTARLLARYVNRAVRTWVQSHLAPNPELPLGIAYQLDGQGADLPLAECPPRPMRAPDRPPEFPYLVPDGPVAPGTTLIVEGELLYDCDTGDFWLSFIDGDRFAWPALQVTDLEFRHSIALPSRFTGGSLTLACVGKATSEDYREWLKAGHESRLSAPGEVKVLLSSPITIRR